MAIAKAQPGARNEDRQEERRPGRQVARVHVAAVQIGRDGRARTGRRRHADLSAERCDGDADPGQELGSARRAG